MLVTVAAAVVVVVGCDESTRRMKRNRNNCCEVVTVLKKVDEYTQMEEDSNQSNLNIQNHPNRMGCGKKTWG